MVDIRVSLEVYYLSTTLHIGLILSGDPQKRDVIGFVRHARSEQIYLRTGAYTYR